jgi:hypothetical protein
MVADSLNKRGGVVDINEGHVIRTIQEYALFRVIEKVWELKSCSGKPPQLKYNCPTAPSGYTLPQYIAATLSGHGVKLTLHVGVPAMATTTSINWAVVAKSVGVTLAGVAVGALIWVTTGPVGGLAYASIVLGAVSSTLPGGVAQAAGPQRGGSGQAGGGPDGLPRIEEKLPGGRQGAPEQGGYQFLGTFITPNGLVLRYKGPNGEIQ